MFLLRQGLNVRRHANENVCVVKKTCDATILKVVTLAYVRIKWNRYKYILDNDLVLSVLNKS